MTILYLGLALFFGVHLLSLTPLRAPVRDAIGEKPYKGIYSLVALVGLGLMIWGYNLSLSGPAAFPYYEFYPQGRHITMLLVLLAMILLASAHMRGHIRKIVRHPMSLGVALWAFGHLLVNDKFSDLLLFGGFLALSLLDIIVNTARGKVPTYQPQWKFDVMAVVGGIVVYLIILKSHFWLFGVSPI
jgi:uncharacterized membrane protein